MTSALAQLAIMAERRRCRSPIGRIAAVDAWRVCGRRAPGLSCSPLARPAFLRTTTSLVVQAAQLARHAEPRPAQEAAERRPEADSHPARAQDRGSRGTGSPPAGGSAAQGKGASRFSGCCAYHIRVLTIEVLDQARIAQIDAEKGVSPALVDTFQRQHNYLRISLTERCNLRCTSPAGCLHASRHRC